DPAPVNPGKVVVGSPSVDPHAQTGQQGSQNSQRTMDSASDQARTAEAIRNRPIGYEVRSHTITETHTPTNWSKNISEADIARIQKALEEFGQVMTVLNMGLAFYDLADQGFDRWTILNTAAALGNTITSFEILAKMPQQTLRRVAFITAILDTV